MEIKWICNKLSRNYLSKKRFGTIRWYSGIKKQHSGTKKELETHSLYVDIRRSFQSHI